MESSENIFFSFLFGIIFFLFPSFADKQNIPFYESPSPSPTIDYLIEKSSLAKKAEKRTGEKFLRKTREKYPFNWDYVFPEYEGSNPEDCLFLSPDKNKCLSVVGYCGEEPDSFVILEDFQQPERVRVGFCGTPCRYLGAEWISNHEFGIIKEEDPCSGLVCKRTIFEVYDLDFNAKTTFSTPFHNKDLDSFSPPYHPLSCPQKS
jgi:hypothetical protein